MRSGGQHPPELVTELCADLSAPERIWEGVSRAKPASFSHVRVIPRGPLRGPSLSRISR
jgi:hypothetical protein